MLLLTMLLVPFVQVPLNPNSRGGDTAALYDLLERILPGERRCFTFEVVNATTSKDDTVHVVALNGSVVIKGTGTNELAAGLGFYLREHCSAVIGWPRGGGSRILKPAGGWPDVVVEKKRIVPWSYAMNVCTHSYSLVWYSWEEWQTFIDWMALSGINNFLAETGQEEIAWKVFTKLGVKDQTIRSWFNGPALLTWSRGQNEYGGNIAGPLPRSFMKAQWNLQKQILNRTRALGMVGQLPAFQAAIPSALKYMLNDTNATDNKQGTAWLDALDPLFLKIADLWMATMLEDFGTDHWYQLDGYFNGGTAPWYEDDAKEEGEGENTLAVAAVTAGSEYKPPPTPPPTLPPHDPSWKVRGAKAWASLSRTDPDAVWSYQGWAILNADSARDMMHGFISAVPKGRFSIIDMAYDGRGEWRQEVKYTNGTIDSDFSPNFIWWVRVCAQDCFCVCAPALAVAVCRWFQPNCCLRSFSP